MKDKPLIDRAKDLIQTIDWNHQPYLSAIAARKWLEDYQESRLLKPKKGKK